MFGSIYCVEIFLHLSIDSGTSWPLIWKFPVKVNSLFCLIHWMGQFIVWWPFFALDQWWLCPPPLVSICCVVQFAVWFNWLCGSIGYIGSFAAHAAKRNSKCNSCMVWYFIVFSSNGLPSNTKALLNFLPPVNEVCEGYVFTRVCHSVKGGAWSRGPGHRGVPGPGGAWSQGGCLVSGVPGPWGVWFQHALQVSRPTPKGEVEGDLVQAHTQGEVEGDLVQTHTQGGSWGGSGPGPHPGQHPRDSYCCGRYASYWNAFLLNACIRYAVHVLSKTTRSNWYYRIF